MGPGGEVVLSLWRSPNDPRHFHSHVVSHIVPKSVSGSNRIEQKWQSVISDAEVWEEEPCLPFYSPSLPLLFPQQSFWKTENKNKNHLSQCGNPMECHTWQGTRTSDQQTVRNKGHLITNTWVSLAVDSLGLVKSKKIDWDFLSEFLAKTHIDDLPGCMRQYILFEIGHWVFFLNMQK